MAEIKENTRELALYLHIPFCVRKCLYCDFLSAPAGKDIKERYVSSLLCELQSWGEALGKYHIRTIFIGGGTPTCLAPDQMERLLHGVAQLCAGGRKTAVAGCTGNSGQNERFCAGGESATAPEFTVEANPGTVLPEHLPIWREAGVNRVSLGLQSARDEELLSLGRIHTWTDFLKTYGMLREAGFCNINVDIMSAIPGQSLSDYLETLEKVAALKPEHISAYSLILEEGTPFYDMEEKGLLTLPTPELDREMYQETERFLGAAGYRRYEISNYALPGRECRHNLTYWNTEEYLGVGLGAASCLGGYRFQNTGEMEAYLASYSREKSRRELADAAERLSPPFQELHRLTRQEQIEEFMFLGLRKMEGISVRAFRERFGVSLRDVYGKVLQKLTGQGVLKESAGGERVYLTERGIDVSNVVLAEFLL